MTIKIAVDMDKCQGYRQCCLALPDVFRLGEGKVRYKSEVEESQRDALAAAMKNCPTQAITTSDQDANQR